MSDAQAKILVQAEMNDRLSVALERINHQLHNTVRSLNGLKATSQNAVGATNAVGAAISKLSRTSNTLSSSLKNNALNQHALSASFKTSRVQADALNSQLGRLQTTGLNTTPIRAYITQLRVMDSMQKEVGNSMRAMQFQQMGNQLNAFSQRMTNAGTRITMGLTLPLVAFMRMGFQSFKALDKQVVRTSKLIGDSFDNIKMDTDGMTDFTRAMKVLNSELDKVTGKWGVSRELVQGLAGDFAEMGISDPKTLGRLTELTVEFEKLGNIDITKAQSTIQSMFQTISRIRTDKGLDVTSNESLKQMIAEVDGAIAFFNFAENKTTLSLNNIAEAFPEVTAAATSFGLNMQTTAAMLVPMIGAAFQTGASANSIKVSLQRMVATTKQNAEMLKDLSGVLGEEFAPSLDLGAEGVMQLITNYDLLQKKLSKREQLVFMSKLFGVRQGPRMEVAIAQMNKYSRRLEDINSKERELAMVAEKSINAQLVSNGYDKIKIENLVDINTLSEKAQAIDKNTNKYTDEALKIQEGQKIALYNLENQNAALLKNNQKQYYSTGMLILDNAKKLEKQNKVGEQFNDIQTESGKLLTAQIFGKSLTEKNKTDELDKVRQSIEVQYGIARENIKLMSRELVTVFGDVLKVLNPILKRVADFIKDLSPQTKKIVGVIIIALLAIGPLMRTIGAIGQLGAMFSNARAAGIRAFKGNVVALNDSLLRTSDIALRIGGNFKKFGQDGKIFTSRKDAKRLEKLAPIIAKQDRGEELTAKESSKGAKYVRKLAGVQAVKEGKALLPQKNFYGLDQTTKEYVRSLDPVVQSTQMVSNMLEEHAVKTRGILRRAAARALRIRGASNNNASLQGIDPATGGMAGRTYGPSLPTPAPITSAIGGISTLRDILTQILASMQAIQACVCNAKAATTGRPSPAASGAPTNAPPFYPTPTGAAIPAATATGTSAPAGAAATAATRPDARQVKRLFNRPATLPMVSPDVVNNNIPTPASLLPKPDIPAVKEKLPLWMSKGPSEKRDAAKAKLDLAAKGARGSIDIALGSSLKDAAQSVMVSIGKKPVSPVTNPIPAAIGEATTAAQESVASGVRKVKRLLNSPATGTTGPIPAAIETATVAAEETVATNVKAKAKGSGKKKATKTSGPIPAAVETAVVEAEKVVAEAVVEGAKKKAGRPKGSTNKPKQVVPPVPVSPPVIAGDPFSVVARFGGLGNDPIIRAKVKVVQSITDIVAKANQTGEKLGVDFTTVGKDIVNALNIQEVGKNSYAVTKEALISLFKTLGVQVPADLAKVADLINKETGQVITTSAAGIAKLAARIKTGTTGVAIGAGSNLITGESGNPFYVKNLNTDYGKATGTGQKRTSPAVIAERLADAPVAIADQKNDEERLRRRVEELKGRIVRVQQIGEKIDIKVAAILEEKRAVKDVNIKAKLEARIQRLQQHARVLNDYEAEIAEAIERGTRTLTGARATGTGFQIAQGRRSSPDGSGRQALPSMQTARRLAYKVPAFGEIAPSYLDVAYGSRGTKGRDSALFKERMSLAPSREIDPEVKAAKADQIAAGKIKLAAAKRYAASLKEFPILKPSEQPTSTRSDGGSVVNRKMTQDDLLRVNRKDISETQSLISKLEERISGIQSRISEINNQARTPGGKPAALRPLNTALKEIEGQIKEAKKQLVSLTTLPTPVSPKQAKADIRRKNESERSALIDRMGFDPNRIETMPKYIERSTAPDISPSARPKSLSAGVQSGATTLGNINSQLSAALQIPTAVLDQFYQTLKIQGKGLAEVATNAGLQATDDLALLKQELLKIGLTVEQAIAKPAESLKQLQAAKFEKGGDVQALFQRLVMYARDVADKGVQEAFDLTKKRLDAAKARAGGAAKPVAPKSAPAPSAASSKAEYGFGLPRGTDEGKESGTQKGLAKEVADRIRTTRKSTEDFLLYEKKTLEYIAKEFGIKGASKIKAKDLVVKLNEVFKDLSITVEKAIVTTAVAPVTAATNAVVTTSATTAGATADETAAVVNAGKNLTVAVEKTVGTAAKAVEKAAVVVSSTNAYLAAMKEGVQSPLAPRTVGGSGAKATDTTPAVAVNKPYSAPYLAQINNLSTSAEFAAAADTIGFDLRLMKDATLKQLQQMVTNINIALRSVNASAIDAQFGTLFGGNLAKALEQVEDAIRQKLAKEAEKVKTVAAAVTAAPVAPAPPVAPRPTSSAIPLSPEGSKPSGVVVNPATKAMLDVARVATDSKPSGVVVNPATKAMLDVARTAGAMAAPDLTAPTRVNLREIIAERLAIKAAMAERIRDNVSLSQAIRERSAAMDAANRADREARRALDPSSIASVPIPPRPSAGRVRIPPTREEFAGQTLRGTASALFNPMTTVRGIIKTGSLIGSALEGVAKKVSPKRFGTQDVYKQRDYMGEARRTTFGRITDRNLQVTGRQARIAEKDARVIAKETRATDRPNRNIARLTQSQLPSQFRQAINPSIDTLNAIAKTYGPPIKSAMNLAKQKSIEGLKIAGQVTRELTLLPIRAPMVFTAGLVEAHKFAMKGVRAGIAQLENIAFFNTTYTGAAIIKLAQITEQGLTKLGKAVTVGGQTLLTSGQVAAKFIQTAFTDPKQALAMAATGLTNSKDMLSKAGAGLSQAASSIKSGAAKLKEATKDAYASGKEMAGKKIKEGVQSTKESAASFFYGGGPKALSTDADGNTVKKGGLFGKKIVTDPTGNVVSKKGVLGRMTGGVSKGIGKGLTGAIGGLGNAAGSMSSMMLTQLGPAGMALQGPMNKVITLLTRTKLAFFGVTLPIMLVVGAIFLLKRTFNAWKDQSTGVAENFGAAFKAIGAVVNMLKTAFFDFFASLFGGAEDSSQATGNIAKTVSTVADRVRKFAEAFKAFFEKTILPAIYTFLSGLSMVIKGIVSFVGNLIKFVVAIVSFFRGGGDKAKEAMGNAFKGMLKALVNVMKGLLKMILPVLNLLIMAFFKVVEFVVQLFEWLVIGVINLIRHMVTGIINLAFTIAKAYVFIIDKIIDTFVFLEKKLIDISAFIVKGVIKVFFGIIRGVLSVVQKIIEVFGLIPSGLGKIMEKVAGVLGKALGGVSWLARKVGLDGLADGIDKFKNSAKDFTSDIVNFGKETALSVVRGVGTGVDWAENKALGLVDTVANVAKNLYTKLGGLGDSIGRLLQSAQNGLLTGVDAAANATNAFIGGFSDGIAGLSKDITDWLSGLVDGNDIKKNIGDAIGEAVKEAAEDPSGPESAGKSIAKAIGEGMKSLKDNFYDKVISNLSDSLGKLKDQVTKALEKQKDQSLKFFDDQIAAIDALAAADAELTAEKQKQEDERLRIAERALQRDSYLKNRALAIYEGRIDDARTLGLEEAKNQQEFNRETEKNSKEAQAAAKAKNVEAAKQVITNQKQVASDQFDKDLEDFQTFIENIGKNGTLTAAELTTQFNELKARADRTSAGMQAAFQGYYNALPNLIANNTAPTVGFFTSSMDALIAGAAGKFGLDTGSTDPATMLGLTNAMMGNIGTVYTNGFSGIVAPAYNDGQELLAGIAREFADPSSANPKSAAGIYASAISNATAAVRAEFMKMKTDASSAFAEVVKGINDELKGLAITKAINDAKEELKNTGGGTAPSGGSATSPATGVTGPTAPTGYGPNGLTEAGFLKAAGTDKVFKLNNKSSYIKAAKAALAFYGYTGFDVGTDVMGVQTVNAVKNFQKKYGIGSGSGDLGTRTAESLGIFNKVGVQKKFMGGIIKREMGGSVPGYTTQGVPAILHGGEYVISSKAVQNLGLGLLTQLNGLKHGVPSFNVPKPQMPSASGLNMSVTSHSTSETTQNYNFYVDNFIGEDQWFESMMKDYNIKVVPNNQKTAGLESRVVRTYNGLNRGM